MTAADFRNDVRAELDQLRRAHVIAGVEIDTDIMVGVRLALDGKPYAFTMHVTSVEQRQTAFEQTIEAVRRFRRDHAPSRRPTPRPRIRIPVERDARRERWSILPILAGAVALCAAVMVAVAWILS